MIKPRRKSNNVLIQGLSGKDGESVFHTSLTYAELVCGLQNYGMKWKKAESVSDSELSGKTYQSLWMTDEEEETMRIHYKEQRK